MKTDRIDLVLKYILAVAGQEDPGNQEVGPIHLIKYVYLGDLAYAEMHDGETFTNCEWQFYHYGPWCNEVYQRIQPVATEVHALEKRITSNKYDTDFVRWKLQDEKLLEQLGSVLPFELTRTIKRAVHEFGDDTSSLLHYVYKTRPMLNAAPGKLLSFQPPKSEVGTEYEITFQAAADREQQPISAKAKKRRKEKLATLRERIQARLTSAEERKNMALPDPAPRYDEIFINGQRWLDEIDGSPIEATEGEIIISTEIWKSRETSETDLS